MNTDLRARILAEAKATPSPTRDERRRRATLVFGVSVVAILGLFLGMGGVSRGARPLSLVAFSAGFALLAAFSLTRLSGARPRSMLPRPASLSITGAAAAALALALLALAAAALWPGPATEDLLPRQHFACAAMTVIQGALPLAVLVVPRRGTDPVHPSITGGALGMTAGAWAATMAYLRCPHAAASHGILAHVAPMLVLTAVGAVLGRALLRIRR